jgi:cytochrome P450
MLQRAPTPGSGSKVIADGYAPDDAHRPQLTNGFHSFIIPESTAVIVPPYTMHRDPRYFSPEPNRFMPERWLAGDDEFVVNQDAFIPFSTGPANCVGRNLAMLEMRMVLAHMVRKFEISFVEGYNPARWEAGLRDHFVFDKGSLPVVISAR